MNVRSVQTIAALVLTVWVKAFGTAGCLDTRALLTAEASCALLAKNYIYAETGGAVPVCFDRALTVFRKESFLSLVQAEYERMMPAGNSPEFVIEPCGPDAWFYVNRKGERTDIFETAARREGDDRFHLVYYTEGRRFFGTYQALIHIRLTRTAGTSAYHVAVYAYPENGVSRFVARRLNLVERYFRSKTNEISDQAIQISTRLCGGNSPSAAQR